MSGGDRPVSVERVFEYAVEQIVAAAGELWPGEPVQLGDHVRSLTNYVQRITVGGRRLYASYAVLGSSLVGLLRSGHGGWDEFLAAQRDYVRQRDSVLARQAGQLRWFAEHHELRVCGLAGSHRGVLFTEAISAGTALDKLLLAEPQQAPALLHRAWEPLTRVHSMPVEGWPMIAELDIAATFARTFLNGQGGTVHFGQPIRHSVDPNAVEGLRFVVRRLRTIPPPRPTVTPVFGTVKPEHVILTGAEPVYLNPGVHLASAASDLATLVNRLLLMVMSGVMATRARVHIMAGLNELVRTVRSMVDLAKSATWMAELLTLVAMDAANILSTYLTAPPTLPLPISAKAVLKRIAVVVLAFEHIVTGLAQRTHPLEIWEQMASEVVAS